MNREPVAIAAAVRGVVLAGVAFGLGWTAEQVAALMFAVEALLALVVRQQVTPTATESERGHADMPTLVVMVAVSLIVSVVVVAAFGGGIHID